MPLRQHPGAAWALHVPSVECVNAIGSGDVCTGIFLHSLVAAGHGAGGVASLDEQACCDAFAWGLAAACARCTHEQPVFERAEVEAMRARIRIEKLA